VSLEGGPSSSCALDPPPPPPPVEPRGGHWTHGCACRGEGKDQTCLAGLDALLPAPARARSKRLPSGHHARQTRRSPAEMAAQPADPHGRSCNHGVQGMLVSPAMVFRKSETSQGRCHLKSSQTLSLVSSQPARPAATSTLQVPWYRYLQTVRRRGAWATSFSLPTHFACLMLSQCGSSAPSLAARPYSYPSLLAHPPLYPRPELCRTPAALGGRQSTSRTPSACCGDAPCCTGSFAGSLP
jgi:hypothetical protein